MSRLPWSKEVDIRQWAVGSKIRHSSFVISFYAHPSLLNLATRLQRLDDADD